MEKTFKVRVGVDPNEDNLSCLGGIKATLNSFLPKKEKSEIIPTYVMGLQPLGWFEGLSHEEKKRAIQRAKNKLECVTSNMGATDWSQPEVFCFEKNNEKDCVTELANLLTNENCDLFVANTHARQGLERAFLGSFSERLLHRVKCPILFNSPKTQTSIEFKNILFPTDFCEKSFKVYQSFLKLKVCKYKKIFLYSQLVPTYLGDLLTGKEFQQTGEDGKEREIKDKKKVCNEWVKYSNDRGFDVCCEVENGSLSLSESIERYADKVGADLVVMGTFKKREDLTFTRSFTMDVIRNSSRSVLVLGDTESEK